MKFSGTKCDMCGRLKADTNHWFVAIVKDDAPFYVGFVPAASASHETVTPRGQSRMDLCSESCAIKLLSRTISPPAVENIAPTDAIDA
jgi:hypothetical protein